MAMVAAAPVAEAVGARAAAGKAAASKGAASKGAAPKGGQTRKATAGATQSKGKKAAATPPTDAEKAQTGASELLQRTAPAKVAEATRTGYAAAGDAGRALTLTPPKRLSSRDASGFLFGMVAYALVINYIRYGKAGVRGWIAAKFINKPMQEPPR